MCVQGKSNMCELGAGVLAGVAPDGTHRVHARGQGVGCMSYLGTFAPYVVAPLDAVIKIPEEMPLDKAALIGCGVPTGWGSSVYAAEIELGDTVVVVGTGGVGMNAAAGRAAQGRPPRRRRRPRAVQAGEGVEFGATHVAKDYEEAGQIVEGLTNGQGADRVIITVGVVTGDLIEPRAGDDAARRHDGAHRAPPPMHAARRAVRPVHVRHVRQAAAGLALRHDHEPHRHAAARRPLPRGELKLDELITRTYTLEDINQAFRDMQDGKNVRGVIIYD